MVYVLVAISVVSANWMPLADYCVYRTIILVLKVLHDVTPNYLDF